MVNLSVIGGEARMATRRERLAARREALGYTQESFAHKLGVELSTVGRWERGTLTPQPWRRSALALALEVSLDELDSMLAGSSTQRENTEFLVWEPVPMVRPQERGEAASPAGVRVDSSYVEAVHARIRELVDMDIQFGGDQSSVVALSLFRSVHRKLGTSDRDPHIERDLYAAAGELGEVVGWLCYDAGKHDLVRRINHEALHLSRLAGDHSMQLLILQNMSMHAGHLGRPFEAMRIARMVLEANTLSPRLEALFRTREARALAQAGDATAAARTYRRARSLYLDGVRDDDPAWAWWINDQELAWHDAMIHADADDWHTAADMFQASIELTPGREVRRQYVHLASLVDAQIRAVAWRDAEDTIVRVMPYVEEVGSTRTATILLSAVDHLDGKQPTPSVREAASHLKGLLANAGYSS